MTRGSIDKGRGNAILIRRKLITKEKCSKSQVYDQKEYFFMSMEI